MKLSISILFLLIITLLSISNAVEKNEKRIKLKHAETEEGESNEGSSEEVTDTKWNRNFKNHKNNDPKAASNQLFKNKEGRGDKKQIFVDKEGRKVYSKLQRSNKLDTNIDKAIKNKAKKYQKDEDFSNCKSERLRDSEESGNEGSWVKDEWDEDSDNQQCDSLDDDC